MSKHIAVDLGAESGRIIVATIAADRLELEEVYRFPNGVVRVGDSLHWDVLRLWDEIKTGLRKVAAQHTGEIRSLAVDTWGIDYALLDRRGALVGNPYAYRDPRTGGMMEAAIEKLGRWEIYRQSGGIQFMSINTLYQLYAMVQAGDPALEIAGTLLMMPDLFGYWLTGERKCEFTDATTTQFYDGRSRSWSGPLLDALGIPTHILPEVILPGTRLGTLLPALAEETGLGALPVIAVAGHDTASAIVAVPAAAGGRPWAWLSSGTWSLLGGVSSEPLVTPQALALNFSSYGGPGGLYLPWKNIMGLWLVQECRRSWEKHGVASSYDQLTTMAGEAQPFSALLDPDDPSFLAPKDMPAAIAGYCRRTGQTVPAGHGEMIRAILESLALCYRRTLDGLALLQGCTFETLHIVGGGSRNHLLCQFTADALGIPVVAGPVEATAIGNAVLQAAAIGDLASLKAARDLVRATCSVIVYEPAARDAWDAAYGRFCRLTAAAPAEPPLSPERSEL
jgi:rhamnulokinase